MLRKVKSLPLFKDAVKKLNTDTRKWRCIGYGSFGTAYDMGDGRVCKITINAAEIKLAKKVKNRRKKLKSLYKVIDVIKINDEYSLVITPRYKKLPLAHRDALFAMFNHLGEINGKLNTIAKIEERLRYNIKAYAVWPIDVDVLVHTHMSLVRKFNICGILKSISALGHRGYIDLHQENIMLDKNRYILIDVAA